MPIRLVLFLLAASAVFAQYGIARKVITGTGSPPSADCDSSYDVGNVYARNNAAAVFSTFYVCGNTAANTYAWELYGSASGSGTVNNGAAGSLGYYLGTGTEISALSTGFGILSWITTPSSANLRGALTDETGSGAAVFATAPTITLPNATGLPLATGVTGILPIANGGTGVVALFATNAQTSTYQVLAADFAACKTITVASGTFTITLVASGSQPTTGQCITVLNYGTGVVTLARSGQNINGAAANLTGTAGSATAPTGWRVYSNGTNYFAEVIGGGSATATVGFTATATSSTLLSITAGTAMIGTKPYPQAASTATLSGSTASSTAYGYLNSSGVYMCAHNGAATLTGGVCTVATGVTDFPVDSVPLWSATYVNNVWTTITSYIPTTRRDILAAGSGISLSVDAAGVQTIASTATPISPAWWSPYGFMVNDGNNTTAWTTPNKTQWARFTVPVATTIAGVGIWAKVGIGGGAGLRFAIANTAGTILYTSAVNTTCANDSNCLATMAATLSAGDYYLGITTDSTVLASLQHPALATVGDPYCQSVENATTPLLAGTGTAGSGTGASVVFGGSMGSITSWSCDGGSNTLKANSYYYFFYN